MLKQIVAASLALSGAAFAITDVNLANYQVTGQFTLPGIASEASSVTYNPDTNTLFVVGDEGDAIVQVTKTGQLINSMFMTGFDDVESVTYIGGGQFVVAEERTQDIFLMNFVPSTSVARNSLQGISIGPTVGNIGIEGLSYEASTGNIFAVKETDPQNVIRISNINWSGSSATVTQLFNPESGASDLNLNDLSDIQLLNSVPSLIGTADENNLLIFSQASAHLLEVTRSGTILSEFDFSSYAGDGEGLTIDHDGTIYITAEGAPTLFVLTQVPEPSAVLLLGVAGAALLGRRRRA